MASNGVSKDLPRWALPTAIVVGVIVVALIGYRALNGSNPSAGQDVKVHAGMYDLRKEVQKRVAGGQSGGER